MPDALRAQMPHFSRIAEAFGVPFLCIDDFEAEITLRPKTMDEYIGQPAMREKLGIFLEAARRRSEALDHVLHAIFSIHGETIDIGPSQ